MKKYEKPVVMINEELAEGVYAASGCWDITVTRDQEDAGGYSTYRIDADHSTDLQHISLATTLQITFSTAISQAKFEDSDEPLPVSGCTVYVTREAHGNSYLSGDNFNSLLKVWTVDGSVPEKQASVTHQCTKTKNVQDKFD